MYRITNALIYLALTTTVQFFMSPADAQFQENGANTTGQQTTTSTIIGPYPDSLSASVSAAADDLSAYPAGPFLPFPQHRAYFAGSILPNHVSQKAMDDSVRAFYLSWKQHYVLDGCGPQEKYIWFEGTAGTNICVSEGQGYGMMIVALMAGFDSTAQETYDALYRFYKSHPASSSPHLMAWSQNKDCVSIDGGTATDGDMDIAYSLLLADAQWGKHSTINYKEEALEMIQAIRREEVNPDTYIVMESNGWTKRSGDYYDMRSSDFMPDHLRAFRDITGDAFWDSALTNNYRVFHYLQSKYSPDAGLVPDFIQKVHIGEDAPITAVPARPNYLESKYDGLYNFNACRVPWRIAADFLVSGDPRAGDFLKKVNTWIRTTTKGNPDNISAGYTLNGEDLPHRYFEALCFICPFAVASMTGHDQQWLNKLWDYITHFKRENFDYYDNSIKMIDLIILSGNYWSPSQLQETTAKS